MSGSKNNRDSEIGRLILNTAFVLAAFYFIDNLTVEKFLKKVKDLEDKHGVVITNKEFLAHFFGKKIAVFIFYSFIYALMIMSLALQS